MIADMDYQKFTANAGNHGTASNPNVRSMNERFPWLSEACSYAVDAAFNLIRFISTAIEQNAIIRVYQ